MITIKNYTGIYNSSLQPGLPKIGSRFKIHHDADAREVGDFTSLLFRNELDYKFVRGFKTTNEFRVTAREIP